MAVSTIGNSSPTIDIDELGVGVTPVWGARSLSPLIQSLTISEINNLIEASCVFDADIPVTLADGKSLGKYVNGDTIPAAGENVLDVIIDIANEYLDASFTSFTVSGPSSVEVGTTLSGTRDFTWSIDAGSGSIPTIDIYDITDGSTLALGTTNDGATTETINSISLTSAYSTQQWRGIGTDINTTPDTDFNSSAATITAYFYRYFGPTSSAPANSAEVKALSNSVFQTSNSQTFTFTTNTSNTVFVIALPPGRTITNVIDTDALNANITSEFTDNLTNVDVTDASGVTTHSYNVYTMTIADPYSTPHDFTVTTA